MANIPPQGLLSYLTNNLGYSPQQAAALVGNIEQESGFNPSALNKNEGAFGLLQWRGPRLDALHQFAAATGGDPSDWQTQLNFAKYEMGGAEAKSAAPFLSASTVPAANAALHGYIRYGDNSEGKRLQNAQNFGGGLGPQYAAADSTPLTPGTQAPPLPPATNVGGATAQQQPPIAAASPSIPLMGFGGQAKQPQAPFFAPPTAQTQQPPQNPAMLMAMTQPPPNTQGLQKLLQNSPALRGLIV